MSTIEMKHIYKSYGEQRVLSDFNMYIEKNEFISVIGGSGSGKTTVLKLINGLLSAEQGEVLIDGIDITSINQTILRRNIGYVIQTIGLFPNMNIKANITFVLKLQKWKDNDIEQRVNELMDIVHLDLSLLNRFPDELSGGQKQRVGIARALAAHPSLLLMDEPFGAVDAITRRNLQDEIISIHAQLPITIFFITHDISEALRLGQRIMVMKDGNIEQFGTPKEIITHPKTDYVKLLLSYTSL